MQHLLSVTAASEFLRLVVPIYHPKAAAEYLEPLANTAALLHLYQHFFPDNWRCSTASIYSSSREEHSPREMEFLELVNDCLFEIEWHIQFSDEQERLMQIPVLPCGIDWGAWLENESLDSLEPGEQLLLLLSDNGRFYVESLANNEGLEWYQDAFGIKLKNLAQPEAVNYELLKRLCNEAGEPLTALPETINMLNYNTGNPFLDASNEMGNTEWMDWSVENVVTLAKAWIEKDAVQKRVYGLRCWVEKESCKNFKKVIKLWNCAAK